MGTVAVVLRSVIYMAGFIFVFGWLALGLRQFDASLGFEIPAMARPLGGLIMAVGLGVVLTCGGLFAVLGRGTPAIFDPPTEFVARGLYRWVRNPMYVGGLTLLFGFALWHRSPSIVLMTFVMAIVFHLFVVFVEEPGLKRRFGAPYDEYRRTVRRWIPVKPR